MKILIQAVCTALLLSTVYTHAAFAPFTDTAKLDSAAPDTAQAFSTLVSIKRPRIGMMKVDLSSVTNPVSAATLTVYATSIQSFNLYMLGVVDGASGQDWSSASATYNNVASSGLFTPADDTYAGADGHLVSLGGAQAYTGDSGNVAITFSGAALVDLLNNDTDGKLTFVFHSDSTANGNIRPHDHSTAPPTLEYTLAGTLPPEFIAPNDTNIVFSGSKYITADSSKVSFLRHSDDTLVDPDRAFTTSKATKSTGISVSFKTASDSILVKFSQDLNEGARFSHIENNGAPVTGSYSSSTNLSFTINSATPGLASVYRITLPPWAKADFRGLELDEGFSLLPYTPPVQKQYVAIGDSITHGRGQRMTSETYPWLVAEALNLDLYNLAVGGSKVSVPVAEMLSEFPAVDVISVLIGWNDLHGGGKTVAEYAADLAAMLDALRVSQPDARVVCISPIYTTAPTNETTGATIQEFRQVIYDGVAARRATGDYKVHLIRGEELTSAADLNDTVHLSIDGAAHFATELAPLMEPLIAGTVDFDGDKLVDAYEEALGTDPVDPDSLFAVNSTPLPISGTVQLSWPSASDVLYRIWESSDLVGWTVASNWAVALTPPEDIIEFDLSPSNGFFKIEADIR